VNQADFIGDLSSYHAMVATVCLETKKSIRASFQARHRISDSFEIYANDCGTVLHTERDNYMYLSAFVAFVTV
jgi:hypothetical protein